MYTILGSAPMKPTPAGHDATVRSTAAIASVGMLYRVSSSPKSLKELNRQ